MKGLYILKFNCSKFSYIHISACVNVITITDGVEICKKCKKMSGTLISIIIMLFVYLTTLHMLEIPFSIAILCT